jgi:hypothetical protein
MEFGRTVRAHVHARNEHCGLLTREGEIHREAHRKEVEAVRIALGSIRTYGCCCGVETVKAGQMRLVDVTSVSELNAPDEIAQPQNPKMMALGARSRR